MVYCPQRKQGSDSHVRKEKSRPQQDVEDSRRARAFPAAARLHQSAAMAVAAPLCERYAGTYGRKAVVKVVSATAAIPAPLSARMARRTDFLLGAALWLLDYWEMHCGSDDDYLSLLPLEPDERLEYDIPFSEDLDHSRDVLVRTLTLLRDRDGAYRKEFRALLALVDDEAATELRQRFKAAFLDYMDRILEVYDRLQPVTSEPPPFLGASLPGPDFMPPDDLLPSERPDTIALFMAPELICRPVAEIQEQLGSRKAAELLSGYGTDDPYALCAAYLLLEREKDALANLNSLTAIVMICAERHLPWTQDDFDARADLSESGGPDYRMRYEYRMVSEDDTEGDDAPDWLVSEAQLFYIATGVIPPRDQQPSDKLIRWFMSHGIAEQRARELAFGAMFAYYTDAGEHGWKAFDWPFDDGGDADAPSEETEEPLSAPLPAEDHAAQIESLARKVKELRGALRKNGIPVRYFSSASAKKCAVQLALDELAAGKKRDEV